MNEGPGPELTGPAFATFTDAYLAVLSSVTCCHQYETATRGNTAHEILNVTFTVRDPLARSPYLAARKANIVFNHAEALWYLSGRDDLAMIAHYAPRLRGFSADGRRLTGTAYGPRLFGPAPDGSSQLDRVIALLRADPGGVLAAGLNQIEAVRAAEERAAACAAQDGRQTRALAALTTARHRADATSAGVTAAQPCPHCGCRVAVLITLIQQPLVPQTVLGGEHR
jgi:hypothetical protein